MNGLLSVEDFAQRDCGLSRSLIRLGYMMKVARASFHHKQFDLICQSQFTDDINPKACEEFTIICRADEATSVFQRLNHSMIYALFQW